MKKHLFKIFILIFFILYTFSNTLYYFSTRQDKKVADAVQFDDNIIYREIEDYEDIVTVLQYKNYSVSEINNILGHLSDDNIIKLTKHEYMDLTDFLEISNFDVNNFDRYAIYKIKNKESNYSDIVTYVNIGLDNEFYTNYKTIENTDDITLLLNKYNKLPDNYEPSDLTSLSYNSRYKLRKEAAVSFENLVAGALSENISLYPYSAYRSYKSQEIIYNRYVKQDGVKLADTYSARPGFSEHQTGLAVDIRSTGYDKIIDNHYEWLKNNSYKYGFIIRYSKDNQWITGYQEERWHLRYIGITHATSLHEKQITYDEYYDLYIKTY